MHKITRAEASASVGGDLGLSLLESKTAIIPTVVDEPDLHVEKPIERTETFPPPERPGPLGRAWRRVVRAFVRLRAPVVAAARPDVRAVVAYVGRYGRASAARPRVGRHRAARRWFGRQRSTAQRCAANAAACRAAAKEGELPRVPYEYVSWVETFIETLRAEQEALHPARPTGRHFVCS